MKRLTQRVILSGHDDYETMIEEPQGTDPELQGESMSFACAQPGI